MFSDVLAGYTDVVLSNMVSGQAPDTCAIFFRDDDVAVVNLDRGTRVTLFKYSPEVSKSYDDIWNQIRG